MPDETRIDCFIESVVAGSGLDARRRADLAEELRGHLLQLIAAKREEGFGPEKAVDAALAQFGRTDVIRSAMRCQRRAADLRTVLADVRHAAWIPIGISVLLAAVIAAAAADVSLTGRVVMSVVSAVGLLLGLALPIFAGFCWCRARVLRASPEGERKPAARVLGWTLRISALLTAVGITAACTFALATSYFEMSGWGHAYAPAFAYYLAQALARVLPLICTAALLAAILLVTVERSFGKMPKRDAHAIR